MAHENAQEVLKKHHIHTKDGPKAVEYEHQEFPKMYYHVKGKQAPRVVSSQKAADALGKDWHDKAPELEGGSAESVEDARKGAEADEAPEAAPASKRSKKAAA